MDKIKWIDNTHPNYNKFEKCRELFPKGISRHSREFHDEIPGFEITPLKSLNQMAKYVGVRGLWVKDESVRLNLNSFKVLGGSYAIYRFLKKR